MRLKPPVKSPGQLRRAGFTLIEVMIAIAIGIAVIATVLTLAVISAQNFAATANYVQMNDQSRNALDLISREIRNATAVVSIVTNSNPKYIQLTNSVSGTVSTISYDSTASTLSLATAGQGSRTVLTGCDSFSFQLYNRYPNPTNMTFSLSTNASTGSIDPKYCKLVNMSWKCSRSIKGSKLNTEIVQTAQVVLRNQVIQ